MHGIPNGIDVGDFVGKKFNSVKRKRDSENPGVREHLERIRQMDDTVTLKNAEGRNGGV